MKYILRKIGASLLIATAVTAASFGQVKSMGVGKPVIGVTLDPKKFNPQIDNSPRLRQVEKEHEMEFNFPLGTPNNLITGGMLQDSRITPGFTSLFPGMSATAFEPPDPDIAVGPTHIVEVVNSDIAFFNKTGTKIFQQTEQTFFKSIAPDAFDYDPKVIYDQVAKRFVVIDLGLNDVASSGTSNLLIAVSATSDPTGTWKLFKVDVKQTSGANTYWWDYPGIGYNKDMIAFSGNMFAMTGSSGFNGVQLVAFDKALLYSGTATPNKFSVADGFTIQLAKTEDATSPSVYGVEVQSQTSMRLTAITKANGVFSVAQHVVPVPQWFNNNGFIAGPGGVAVQTNDPRQLTATSFNGHLLSSHCVGVSAGTTFPAARWYDFKTNNWPISGTPTLTQSGQLDPPGGHGYTFPAIQIDKKGGIGMTFSMIGTSTPGKVMGTGRKPTDPPGTMGTPIVLDVSTSGTYNGFSTRWGDYFDLELDPTDSTTFWAVGMGAGANGRWQTFIKSFKISSSDADLTPVFAAGVTTVAGTLNSGDRTSLNATDSKNLAIDSTFVRGLGQVAGFNSVYTMPFTGGLDTLRIFLNVTGPTGSSVLVSLKNKNTGAFDQISSIAFSSPTPSPKTIDLSPEQIALYVTSSNQVSMIVRCVSPSHGSLIPAPFLFKTDQASLGVVPSS